MAQGPREGRPPVRVRFGDFVFDSTVRELTRGGQTVPLSPKAFGLLAALLAARPRVVPQGDLRDLLWPATFVSHTNLPRLVAEVRRALGDDARRPRFIRNVHGFGYAFCGTGLDLAETAIPSATCSLVWGDRQIGLAEGENLIGRTADCTVRLPSPRISRRHARIVVAGEKATLEDLGSKNGTYLRGRPATAPTALADGDQILLGSEVLTFLAAARGSSTRTDRRG